MYKSPFSTAGIVLVIVIEFYFALKFLHSSNILLSPFIFTGKLEQQSTSLVNIVKRPIFQLVESELYSSKKLELGGLKIKLDLEPDRVKSGKTTGFYLEITDAKSGQVVDPDFTVHNQPIHTYAIRKDLKSFLLHGHSRKILKGGKSYWKDEFIFPTSGDWMMVSEFPYKRVLYLLYLDISIEGENKPEREINFSKQVKRQDWTITFETVEKIRKSVPTDLAFIFKGPELKNSKPLSEIFPISNANILFVNQEKRILWNEHGDGSTQKISHQSGFDTKMPVVGTRSLIYNTKFPEAGTWLIYLELMSEPIEFFINVED